MDAAEVGEGYRRRSERHADLAEALVWCSREADALLGDPPSTD